MKRFLFAVLILMQSCFFSFAVGGDLATSSTKIKVIKLEHFDVIYPEEAKEAADKIAGICENFYKQICSILDFDPNIFLPVTITPCVDQLNAYFTMIPYNRIVLYATSPNENLDMFEDTLYSVFYHELTHAITMNMKSPFWKGMSYVFGDVMTPSTLNFTTFWNEGATVSFESMGEGGRLNDPFSVQIVSASKALNKFPSWRDVTGARDTYPSTNGAYCFGASFAFYLQQKYGIEKYSEFWQRAGRVPSIFSGSTTFKAVYKKSLSDEWNEFIDSVYVSDLSFEQWKSKLQLISDKNACVNSADIVFDKNENRTKFVYFDSKSQALFKFDEDKNKSKKVFSAKGIQSVSFLNKDELVLERFVSRLNVKYEQFLYNLKTSKKQNIKNPFRPSDYGLYSKRQIEENEYWAIKKNGLSWKIIFGENIFDLSKSCGKNLIIHNLHLSGEQKDNWCFTFTWSELGKANKMFSRTGKIIIDKQMLNGKFYLQKKDFAFGVVDYLSDLKNDYVVLQMYEGEPLYKIDLTGVEYDEFDIVGSTGLENQNSENLKIEMLEVKNDIHDEVKFNLNEKNDEKIVQEIKIQDYSVFDYFYKGIRLPVCITGVVHSDFSSEDETPIGTTFISSNPWGDKITYISAGFIPSDKVLAVNYEISSQTDTTLRKFETLFNYDFEDSFYGINENVLLARSIFTGLVSEVGYNLDSKIFYGKDKIKKTVYDAFTSDNKLFLYWSNVSKVNPKVYYSKGITFRPFVDYEYLKISLNDKSLKRTYLNCGVNLNFKYPVLLPVTVDGWLYPKKNIFSQFSGTVVLFTGDIQKGLPLLPFYVDRLVLSASYAGEVKYSSSKNMDIKDTVKIAKNLKKDDYFDYAKVNLALVSSLNTGYFANPQMQMHINLFAKYRFRKEADEKKYVFGLSSVIDY